MESYNLLLNYKTTQSNPATRLVDKSEEVFLPILEVAKGGLIHTRAAEAVVKGSCDATVVTTLATSPENV